MQKCFRLFVRHVSITQPIIINTIHVIQGIVKDMSIFNPQRTAEQVVKYLSYCYLLSSQDIFAYEIARNT